jgi:hypothetical protein
MSNISRNGRDEALLSKLDRTMDSILAANAPTQFKPKYFPRYGFSRLVAWITSAVGWAGILVAIAALGLRAGISALPDYAELVSWIEPLWAGGGILAGLVLVNLAAMTRAGLDSADYARQILQFNATRSVRTPVRARVMGKSMSSESEPLRAGRNDPLAEIIEPRLN